MVDDCVVPATGTGERDAATSPVASLPRQRVTIDGDKAYNTSGFVDRLRALEATPHIAQKQKSRTLDGADDATSGYAISQRARKRIEDEKAARRRARLSPGPGEVTTIVAFDLKSRVANFLAIAVNRGVC